jgi:hypothetical protein
MDAQIVDAPDSAPDIPGKRVEIVPPPISLEAAELELALQSQDISERGFSGVIGHVLESMRGRLLFDMPSSHVPGYQRVAAASTGQGDDRRVFLIHLADDGGTIRVEEAHDGGSPLAGFASSCMHLMDRLTA